MEIYLYKNRRAFVLCLNGKPYRYNKHNLVAITKDKADYIIGLNGIKKQANGNYMISSGIDQIQNSAYKIVSSLFNVIKH